MTNTAPWIGPKIFTPASPVSAIHLKYIPTSSPNQVNASTKATTRKANTMREFMSEFSHGRGAPQARWRVVSPTPIGSPTERPAGRSARCSGNAPAGRAVDDGRRITRSGSAGFRLQLNRDSVDAVPIVGRGAESLAGEHVPEVGTAGRTANLGPHRAEGAVFQQLHPVGSQRGVERRPSAVRIELVLAAEQLGAAAATAVHPHRLVGLVRAGERPLGARLAEHLVLLLAQLRAPLLVGLLDVVGLVGLHALHCHVQFNNRIVAGVPGRI